MKAVEARTADSAAQIVFLCEHASNHIPEDLSALGLSEEALSSHIAWDLGALPLAEALARHFEAPLVAACVSRLVYDCNRPPEAPDAIPERSEVYDIPGNRNLSEAERRRRVHEVYEPFHQAVTALLDARDARRLSTALVTVHSFTPSYNGRPRSVELGILHDEDSRLADLLLENAQAVTGLKSARNDPYGPDDGVTHSLQRHGIARGLPNVMLEIRNDLLRGPEQRQEIAEKLACLIEIALEALSGPPNERPASTAGKAG
jgi:predicted N-formylglutamate amidohydrolase